MKKQKSRPNIDALIKTVAECIANQSAHAFKKHHVKKNEFNDPKFGMPQNIKSDIDLIAFAAQILKDPETEAIHTHGTKVYCHHPKTNTIIIIGNRHGLGANGGTIFRRFPQDVKDGLNWLEPLIASTMEHEKIDLHAPQKGGLAQILEKNNLLLKLFEKQFGELVKNPNQKFTYHSRFQHHEHQPTKKVSHQSKITISNI